MESILFTATTIGLPLFMSMTAISRSSAVSPALTSVIKIITSAVSIAICA